MRSRITKIWAVCERQHSFQWDRPDSKSLCPLKPARDIVVPDAPGQLHEKVCKLEYIYIHPVERAEARSQ
jgi:hypothetical protein